MSLDHRLISLLVCPLCKGPLQLRRDGESRPNALVCPADRLAFPIRDGIPIMLESEARPSEDPEGWAAPSPPPEGFKAPGPAGSP